MNIVPDKFVKTFEIDGFTLCVRKCTNGKRKHMLVEDVMYSYKVGSCTTYHHYERITHIESFNRLSVMLELYSDADAKEFYSHVFDNVKEVSI